MPYKVTFLDDIALADMAFEAVAEAGHPVLEGERAKREAGRDCE